jgi:hypothetical protein
MLVVFIEERPNVPPSITLLTPSENDEISTTSFTIRWTDDDPDDDAMISLLYYESLTPTVAGYIVQDLSEDDENDCYVWDTTHVPEMIYWIQAEITDGENYTSRIFAPGSIKVTHVTKEEIIAHLLSETAITQERMIFADFNNDGILDIADLVYLCIRWSASP